jgi:hypothetical protein
MKDSQRRTNSRRKNKRSTTVLTIDVFDRKLEIIQNNLYGVDIDLLA